jgi:uncharacterized repeat protein (TIGR03803 family)
LAFLQASDGNFYIGSESLPGTIYKMTPAGTLTEFYGFAGSEFITGPFIQATDGNFYGTASTASSPFTDYVFRLTPSGTYTAIHAFSFSNMILGYGTSGVIQGPDGNLYGLAGGGTAGRGIVFQLSTDGSVFNILHNFADGSIPKDGYAPEGVLTVGKDNNLYGTTSMGGSAGAGTVYRISP